MMPSSTLRKCQESHDDAHVALRVALPAPGCGALGRPAELAAPAAGAGRRRRRRGAELGAGGGPHGRGRGHRVGGGVRRGVGGAAAAHRPAPADVGGRRGLGALDGGRRGHRAPRGRRRRGRGRRGGAGVLPRHVPPPRVEPPEDVAGRALGPREGPSRRVPRSEGNPTRARRPQVSGHRRSLERWGPVLREAKRAVAASLGLRRPSADAREAAFASAAARETVGAAALSAASTVEAVSPPRRTLLPRSA